MHLKGLWNPMKPMWTLLSATDWRASASPGSFSGTNVFFEDGVGTLYATDGTSLGVLNGAGNATGSAIRCTGKGVHYVRLLFQTFISKAWSSASISKNIAHTFWSGRVCNLFAACPKETLYDLTDTPFKSHSPRHLWFPCDLQLCSDEIHVNVSHGLRCPRPLPSA